MGYALNLYLKTAFLMAVLGAILVGIGYLIGGVMFAFFFLIIALIINLIFYFFSDSLVLMSTGARIVSEAEAPRLHRIVERVASKAGIKKPKVAIVNAPQPNAFATGRGPGHAVVAVTTGLLTIMNDDELEAVIGHEIGHIINRDVLVATIAAAIASAITWLAYAVFWILLARGRNGGEIALAFATFIFAPLTASLIQLAISRSREYLADYTGAKLTGKPQSLIAALTKIENYIMSGVKLDAPQTTASLWISNPFRKGITAEDVIEWFSTHPSTKRRIERLKEIAKEMGIYIW